MSMIHHTTLSAPPHKMPAMVSFYTNVMGLHQIPSMYSSTVWFSEGLHLYPSPDHKPLEGGGHVAFVVGEDYTAIVNAARENGAWLGEGTPYWGASRCYLMDPADNRLEIMEFQPGPNFKTYPGLIAV